MYGGTDKKKRGNNKKSKAAAKSANSVKPTRAGANKATKAKKPRRTPLRKY